MDEMDVTHRTLVAMKADVLIENAGVAVGFATVSLKTIRRLTLMQPEILLPAAAMRRAGRMFWLTVPVLF